MCEVWTHFAKTLWFDKDGGARSDKSMSVQAVERKQRLQSIQAGMTGGCDESDAHPAFAESIAWNNASHDQKAEVGWRTFLIQIWIV